jgi:putative toxin-antitoxin system antitoxin component (TIGR02293 family)
MVEHVEPHRVVGALGLQRKGNYSLLDFHDDIARGFPVSAVEWLRKAIAPDMRASFDGLIVSEATLKRYRKARKPLNPAQSERLARLAEVWTAAMDVYRDEDSARMFLRRPHQLLHGRTPLNIAAESSAGARSVEQVLGRLKHGTAA